MWKIETYKASWKESIEILARDLVILLLVSLRTLGSLYRVLLTAWFLPVALLIGLVLSSPLLLGSFYLVLLVQAARPSIHEKNSSYWYTSLGVDWMIFCGLFLIDRFSHLINQGSFHSLFWYLSELCVCLLFLSPRLWLPGSELLGTTVIFLSPFLILTVLFIFDAQKTFMAKLTSVWRALLMLIYNYPLFLVIYAVLRIILTAGYLVSIPLSSYLPCGLIGWLIYLVVIYPYFICLITNIYVKRLHEQFSLYYVSK